MLGSPEIIFNLVYIQWYRNHDRKQDLEVFGEIIWIQKWQNKISVENLIFFED